MALHIPPLLDSVRANLIAVESRKPPVAGLRLPAGGGCLAGHSYGRALLLRGRYQEALPYLQQGAQCPERRWAWFDLAQAQYELGQWEAAGHSWRQAGAAEHAHRLARQIAGRSDRAQAIRAWEMAINADPKAAAPYLELARLWQETDRKQAEAVLWRDIQANPNDVTLLKPAAQNAAALGNYIKAIELWRQVASLSEKERPAAYQAMGDLTLSLGDLVQASYYFRQAAAAAPDKPVHQAALGDTYLAAGCIPAAMAAYQQALALQPGRELRQRLQATLEELAAEPADARNCILNIQLQP